MPEGESFTQQPELVSRSFGLARDERAAPINPDLVHGWDRMKKSKLLFLIGFKYPENCKMLQKNQVI